MADPKAPATPPAEPTDDEKLDNRIVSLVKRGIAEYAEEESKTRTGNGNAGGKAKSTGLLAQLFGD